MSCKTSSSSERTSSTSETLIPIRDAARAAVKGRYSKNKKTVNVVALFTIHV